VITIGVRERYFVYIKVTFLQIFGLLVRVFRVWRIWKSC